jgi:hypothetical protein
MLMLGHVDYSQRSPPGPGLDGHGVAAFSACPTSASSAAAQRNTVGVIVLAVRWYLRFGLSDRDIEELLTERGVEWTT